MSSASHRSPLVAESGGHRPSGSRRTRWAVLALAVLVVGSWLTVRLAAQERKPRQSAEDVQALERQRLELEEQQRELERRIEAARNAAEQAAESAEDEPGQRLETTPTGELENELDVEIAAPKPEAPRAPRPPRRRGRSDNKFALGSTVRVRAGEVAADVLALGGGIRIDGEVLGDAVAVGGSIKVDGRVTGNVIAIGRNVELGPSAEVLGDAVSVGARVIQDEGATVMGRVSEVAVGGKLDLGERWWKNRGLDWSDHGLWSWGAWVNLSWSLLGSLLLLVLTGLVLVVVPEPVDRVGGVAFAEPFKSVIVGLAVELLFLPGIVVLAVLLTVSIIGIPLLLFLPFLLLLLIAAFLFGFTSMAVGVGKFLKERFSLGPRGRFAFLLVGLIGIQAISVTEEFLDAIGLPFLIYALFGLFGFLIQFLAWTTGLGAVVLSRFGARSAT